MDEFKAKNKEACSPRESEPVEKRRLEAIIQILKDKHVLSGGNCGTYVPEILNKLELDYKTLKPLFIQLFKSEKITVHKGGQGKLIKIKADERK